jgi:hypothetical protein
MLRNTLRLTNRRARIGVGLLLAGLFCVQCTQSQATPETHSITAVAGVVSGQHGDATLRKIDSLARTDHAELLRECISNYDKTYRDYTCVFEKQERIGGELGKEQVISAKFLDQPFSVVMTWLKNKPVGEKLIYIEGKYDNQMLVKPNSSIPFAGLAGTIKRPVDGPDARRNSLRTVNQFGFKRSMLSLLEVYEQAAEARDLKQEFGGYANFEGRRCVSLVRLLPDVPKYPAARTVTYIDLQYLVPICVQAFDGQGQLISSYVFKDIKFNVGLTSDQFLPKANGMPEPK